MEAANSDTNNATAAATRDDSEAFDMPEMNTPSISLEVTETAKDDDAVITEDHNEISVAAGSQGDDLRRSESEQQSDEEIPTPKPQSEEEIPVPKPQPEDQPKAQNPIPEPRSTLSASISQAQGSRVQPKPMPVRSKPIPVPRSKPPTRKGKLLPLREKLAGNANKLVECLEEINFVPTAEWVSS